MDAKQYVKNIQEKIHQLDQGQTEYLQAVASVLAWLPQYPKGFPVNTPAS